LRYVARSWRSADDLRILRGPGGEKAEQAEGSHRDRQLRHRDRQVNFPAAVSTGDLTSAVEQADYIGALPARPETVSAAAAEEDDGAREAAALRQQLLVSLPLAIPVVVLADPEPDRPDHSLQEHHAAVQPASLSSSARRDSPAITRNSPGSHRWRACPAVPPGTR